MYMAQKDGSNGSEESGNTKRIPASKKWVFTLHYDNEKEKEDTIKIVETFGSKYIVGDEIAPTTKKKHLQGYIEFNKKTRPFELFNNKRIHWEKAKGSQEQNLEYCSKEAVLSTNLKIKRKVKIISELYPWQKKLEEIVKLDPDDRTIYWIWEKEGNVGKTQFSKYLTVKYGAIPLEGKKADVLCCASKHDSDIYIYDLERTMEDYISYGSIEKIKNGYYMTTKYESEPITRAHPHLLVFANFRPNKKALSEDRWKVLKIVNKDLVDDKKEDGYDDVDFGD